MRVDNVFEEPRFFQKLCVGIVDRYTFVLGYCIISWVNLE